MSEVQIKRSSISLEESDAIYSDMSYVNKLQKVVFIKRENKLFEDAYYKLNRILFLY